MSFKYVGLFALMNVVCVALIQPGLALAADDGAPVHLSDGVVFASEDAEESSRLDLDELSLDDLDLDDVEDTDADDLNLDDAIDLGEADVSGDAVEIVAAPAPVVTAVISGEEIAQSGAQSVGDLLAREAGFTVNDSYAGTEVTFQGLPSKFTAVLLDGQRIPGRIFERVDFSQLPLDNIERVEIIRGPQAAAYGSESAGVIVNLVTKAPEHGGGSLDLGVGSFGYNRQQLTMYDGSSTDSWYFSLSRKLRESYDLEQTFPDTDGDSYRQYDVFGNYRRRLGDGELKVQVDWLRENAQGQSYSPPDQIRANDYFTRRFQGSVAYDLNLGSGRSLTLSHNSGSYYHDLERFFVDFPDTTRIITGFSDVIRDSRAMYQQYGKDYIFSAGAEQSWNEIESDRISVGDGIASSDVISGFATYEWFVNDRWTTAAALRYDEHSEFGGELTPKLSASYRLAEGQSIEAAVGRGYRPPSLRERYFEWAAPFGYLIIGNEELSAETTWSYNLDYELTDELRHIRLGLFRHDVDDLIVFNEVSEFPEIYQAVNVGTAMTTGVQLSAERRWDVSSKQPELPCTWIATDDGWVAAPEEMTDTPTWFGIGYDGTWLMDAEDGELGTVLPNSPEWDQRIRAFYERGGTSAEVLISLMDSRYIDRENNTEAPSYSTVNMTLRQRESWGEFRLAALNVLDEKDGRFGPEPGRELRAEVKFEF